jgi:hypothetical protein
MPPVDRRGAPNPVDIFADPRGLFAPRPSSIVLDRSREELLVAARST